jgi:hypothetical protein
MDHLIYEDSEVGTARLIREPDATSPQLAVLRIERGEFCTDFGPRDLLDDPWSGEPSMERAADVVFVWASHPERTAKEKRDAGLFLRQWSRDPELDRMSRSPPDASHNQWETAL